MFYYNPDQLGTIIFTNASAAFKGYPNSGAFAMASHGKSGLAASMARENKAYRGKGAELVLDPALRSLMLRMARVLCIMFDYICHSHLKPTVCVCVCVCVQWEMLYVARVVFAF